MFWYAYIQFDLCRLLHVFYESPWTWGVGRTGRSGRRMRAGRRVWCVGRADGSGGSEGGCSRGKPPVRWMLLGALGITFRTSFLHVRTMLARSIQVWTKYEFGLVSELEPLFSGIWKENYMRTPRGVQYTHSAMQSWLRWSLYFLRKNLRLLGSSVYGSLLDCLTNMQANWHKHNFHVHPRPISQKILGPP
jgi:hypothetical protein